MRRSGDGGAGNISPSAIGEDVSLYLYETSLCIDALPSCVICDASTSTRYRRKSGAFNLSVVSMIFHKNALDGYIYYRAGQSASMKTPRWHGVARHRLPREPRFPCCHRGGESDASDGLLQI